MGKLEKKQLGAVFFLNIITTILDTVGIVSIFPFLQIVLNQNIIHENQYLNYTYHLFAFSSNQYFLIAVGVFLVLIFFLSNLLRGYTLWFSTHFIYNCNRRVTTRLLENYFREDYLENIKKNSAQIASHLLTNVDLAISSILLAWIGLASSGFIILSLLSVLLFTQPLSALAIFAIAGVFYYFLNRSIRSEVQTMGQLAVTNSTQLYKNINEATGGVKEIKYLGREKKFINDYDRTYSTYVNLKSKSTLLQYVPKLVVDCLAFSIGIIVVIVVLGNGSDVKTSLPWMGLFAFVILRLVPNTQIFMQHLSKIHYSNKALDLIEQDLSRFKDTLASQKENALAISMKNGFSFKNVCFSYGTEGNSVVKDISFSVKKGEMVAFVGHTGAGKTTLIDLILGLILPTTGEIKVDDISLNEKNIYSWQKDIGYVPQFVFLADDSITNNVAFGVDPKEINVEKVISACKKANIHDFIMEKLPLKYNSIVGERGIQLSGGQRQRLGIARALYHEPEVIILDEATSALDSKTELAVMEEINKIAESKTIIIIAHRLSTVKNCHRIYLLKDGAIISWGNFNEMLTKEPEFFSNIH